MTESSDQKGPWALALGVGLIGVVAVSIDGYRAVRRRLRQNDSSNNK